MKRARLKMYTSSRQCSIAIDLGLKIFRYKLAKVAGFAQARQVVDFNSHFGHSAQRSACRGLAAISRSDDRIRMSCKEDSSRCDTLNAIPALSQRSELCRLLRNNARWSQAN
jgi:hypothetical protein